jgi:translation initiation factor 1A
MPKNKGKGGKNRRRGKNENEEKREMVYREDGQTYGQVLRMLGNGRLEAYCFNDGQKRICHIRGKMRKKIWVNQGDIVLIDLRDFQKDKGDVVHRYNADEARHLKKIGHLPDNLQIENNENQHNEDVPFDFTMANDEDEDNSVEEQDARRGQMLPEYSDSDDDGQYNNDAKIEVDVNAL